MNSYLTGLSCREDGLQPLTDDRLCGQCMGPLEVELNYQAIGKDLTRERIASRPKNMWRYRELLPVSGQPPKCEDVGFTPLYQTDRLAEAWGLEPGKLFVKYEGTNWTGTLKPRVALLGVQRALELGYTKLGCVSTGNLSSTVAAAGARFGLETFIFAPHKTEPHKLSEARLYGATVIELEKNFSEIADYCNAIQEEFGQRAKLAILNLQMRPFYAQGAKTLAFEVAEQLGWRMPRNIVSPVAAGNTLVMIDRGYRELYTVGLAEGETPRIFGAQSALCNPVSGAFKAGKDIPLTVQAGETIAKSLVIPRPGDGTQALSIIRQSNGWAEDASDKEVCAAIAELARLEGVYAGTAGGVTLAVAKKLVAAGKILSDQTTVVYVTDNGLRTPDACNTLSQSTNIGSPRVGDFSRLEKLLLK